MNDEYAYFIVWEAKNHLILDAIKEKIKEIKSEKERDDVKQAFKKQKKEWFRSNLDPKEVIDIANKWWKSLVPQDRFDLAGLAAVHQGQVFRAVVRHADADLMAVRIQDTNGVAAGKSTRK